MISDSNSISVNMWVKNISKTVKNMSYSRNEGNFQKSVPQDNFRRENFPRDNNIMDTNPNMNRGGFQTYHRGGGRPGGNMHFGNRGGGYRGGRGGFQDSGSSNPYPPQNFFGGRGKRNDNN